jgi:hypothetical protein
LVKEKASYETERAKEQGKVDALTFAPGNPEHRREPDRDFEDFKEARRAARADLADLKEKVQRLNALKKVECVRFVRPNIGFQTAIIREA